MDNVLAVQIVQRAAQWYRQRDQFLDRNRRALAGAEERIAGDEFHDQVRIRGVVADRDDARHVRTVQTLQGAAFVLEGHERQ